MHPRHASQPNSGGAVSLNSRLERLERAVGRTDTRAQSIAHAIDVVDHVEQRTNHGQQLDLAAALACVYSVLSDELWRAPDKDRYATRVRAAVLARYSLGNEEAGPSALGS